MKNTLSTTSTKNVKNSSKKRPPMTNPTLHETKQDRLQKKPKLTEQKNNNMSMYDF